VNFPSNPITVYSIYSKASSSGTGTSTSWLGLLEHVSGSLSCDSIRLPSPEKATTNAAGCAHLHDTQTGWRYMPLCSPRSFHFLKADRVSLSVVAALHRQRSLPLAIYCDLAPFGVHGRRTPFPPSQPSKRVLSHHDHGSPQRRRYYLARGWKSLGNVQDTWLRTMASDQH
jgi:hypothetical protein